VRGGSEDGAEAELRLGFADPALAGKIGNRHVAPERGRAGARSFKRRFADWFRGGDVLIAVGEGLWERATRTLPPRPWVWDWVRATFDSDADCDPDTDVGGKGRRRGFSSFLTEAGRNGPTWEPARNRAGFR
jgi:hypothetical protein